MVIITRNGQTFSTDLYTPEHTILGIRCIKVRERWNEQEQKWEKLHVVRYIPKKEITDITTK